MYKIAALGDKDSVCGFASIGIDVYAETEQKSAIKTLRKLSESGYGVVFITEKLAALIQNEIDKYFEKPDFAIILIPGCSGNTGQGMANLSSFVEKAVGSDILS